MFVQSPYGTKKKKNKNKIKIHCSIRVITKLPNSEQPHLTLLQNANFF
jgi:hypothetical protein